MTMALIKTVTVGAGGSSLIQFDSIPQTGKDLYLTISSRMNNTSTTFGFYVRLNASAVDTVTQRLYGTGSSSGADSLTDDGSIAITSATQATGATFGSQSAYIFNYTGSRTKSINIEAVAENSTTAGFVHISGGFSSKTAPVTSLTLYRAGDAATFVQGSTASLYAISTTSATGATVA